LPAQLANLEGCLGKISLVSALNIAALLLPVSHMFPATDSNLRPHSLIEQLLPQYDLGEISRCRLHHRGLNDTYMVECSQGDTYFLRIYRADWRALEEIETEIAILLHLAREKVTVSIPISRRDGQVLTPLDCVEGRRWAALFTCAPGKEVAFHAYNDELAGLYGETVATIHCAADSFEGRPLRPALDLVELLERPVRLLTSTIAHRPKDVDYIVALGDRLRQQIQAMAELEIGFCHGDLHGWNACEKDGSFTVYDFDCCGWGYRAYDLAVFPWVFAAFGPNTTERIEAMGRAYLQGYLRRRRLGPTNVDAIPAFVAIRQIWLLGLHVGSGDRFGWGWINDDYFDRQFKVLRDWEKNWLSRPAGWLQADAG
jgi:Ser/Thr protein kinase RdoA (MazF antagonist)